MRSNVYTLTLFKLSMMTDTNKLHSLISNVTTLTVIQSCDKTKK